MTRYSDEFLRDIARLREIHGMDSLMRFSVDLSEPNGRESLIGELERAKSVAAEPLGGLIAGLSESGETAPEGHAHPKSASSKSATAKRNCVAPKNGLYSDIAVPESKAADSCGVRIFGEMLNTLTSSDIFQRRRVLLELAGQLNVPIAKSDNRKRMMEKIIAHLADMDADRLAQARVCVRQSDRGSTETFMRFGTFIANGARPNGQSNVPGAAEPAAVEIV